MDCPGCGGTNREGARFCTFCGAPLVVKCSSCGNDLLDGARFCDSCGTPVAQAQAEPVAAARKVVTVLFADMTGSTSLEEEMDAEQVRALLDRFYATLRAEVEKRNGRVVKFTGDGLMAAFGVPDVREDDAMRAVDCAVAMCAACDLLATETGHPSISLKVGINTGEVVVIADDDDVVGDSVNIAARLEGAAQSGEVLVGEGTWRLTRASSKYEQIEPLVLKGKSEPVPAYRLVSIDETTADPSATPFVGREDEITRLLSVFEDAVASNSARLVTIVGSPGLGKTRLAREVMSRLAERAVAQATQCDPAGSTTFAPIADALRDAAAIPDAATEDEIVSTFLALIPEEDEDRERIARRVAAILGVGQPGSTEETFWALRRLIEISATVMPLVIVIDDVHWAEPVLLDLIEHLAEWIRDAPVVLVVTGRPELRDLRPSLVEGGRAALVIALEGLDERDTERLAVSLLGTEQVPNELLARIPASTEGNPLFVRELVRMLVDDGVLRRDGDAWHVTVDVEAIEVPPTIQSLLAARMDRLRPDERTVVELASVVGKEFYRGAIHELAPPAVREQLDTCLESLRRKELVEPAGTYWIDEPVFQFHHALIRDAAYRRLLKESRADLHFRVAGWLDAKTEGIVGEHDELIGYHLEQAHEYLRQLNKLDELAIALGQRAASLLGTAAQRALDRDDLPAAAALSGRALDRLPPDDDTRSDLLLIRCEALLSMGDVSAGAAAVAELERLATTPRLRAWATCFSGELANFVEPERLEEIEKRVAAAAVELTELGDLAGAAKAHTVHGATLALFGRFGECEMVLDAAKNAAQESGDRRRITAVLGTAPLAALWGPSPVSRAGGRCLDLIRLSRITTDSPAVEITSKRCQAVLEAFRGRTDAARGMLRSSRRKLTELGARHEILETEQFLGIVELVAGDAAAAATHLRAAYEGFTRVGVDVLAAQSAAMLARAHLHLGEDDEADALTHVSEEHGGQDLKTGIAWRSVRAELLARRGQFDEARRLAEAAVELAGRTDALIDHGGALRSLARVCELAGDTQGARSAYDRAVALYERKGATALVERTAPSQPAPAPSPQRVATSDLTNASTRARDRLLDLFADRQWSAFPDVVAEDCAFDDRRVGLRHTASGPDGLVQALKPAAESGTARLDTVTIATRGERLSLSRSTARGRGGPAGLETEFLSVQELDDDGRITRIVNFDPDDLDAAFSELDERFIAGEASEYANVAELGSRLATALNAVDANDQRALIAEDIVVVDNRPAAFGRIEGSEALIEVVRAARDVLPTTHRVIAFHALTDVGAVIHADITGTTAEGEALDVSRLALIIVRDGAIRRLEAFAPEDIDAALARFQELSAGDSQGALSNRATAHADATTRAVLARDWDAVDGLQSAEVVWIDHRPGFEVELVGKDAVVKNFESIGALGVTRVDRTIIATRGEHLALANDVFGVDFEVEVLYLTETDQDGAGRRSVVYAADDLDAALVELDERFVAGEGAHGAEMMRATQRFARSYNARDWDDFRAVLSEDFVLVDHRLASLGTLARDEYVRAVRALVDLIPGRRGYIAAVHMLTPTICVGRWEFPGFTADGAAVEEAMQVLWVLRGDRLVRQELYPGERLDDAKARFAQLTAASTETLAVHVFQESIDAALARDWETVRSLYTEDAVLEDMRIGFRTTFSGADAVVENDKAAAALGVDRFDVDVLGTRGQRLLLSRILHSSTRDDSFEVDVLVLTELAEDGRISHVTAFDANDLDAAFDKLDERYAAGEGAQYAEDFRQGISAPRLIRERDWGGFREMFTPDFVSVDRTPAGQGEMDREEFVESVRTLVELTSEFVLYNPTVHAIAPGRAVTEFLVRGTTLDGFEFEILNHAVAVARDGRTARFEVFRAEDLDAALARFEELGSQSVPQLENAATRTANRYFAAMYAEDWTTLEDLMTADTLWDDRRPGGLRSVLRGRHSRLENAKAIVAIGVARAEYTPIATRGDRLVLARNVLRGSDEDGFIAETLMITEVDDAGRVATTVVFEPDDLDAAFDELDARGSTTLAELGERHPSIVLGRALNERDWASMRATLADDLVVVDHRPASLGEMHGPDDYIRALQQLVELAPTLHMYGAARHALEPDRVFGQMLVLGKTADGADIELAFHSINQIRGDLVARIELFLLDDFDAARARFDELGSAAGPRLENAATRASDRLAAAMLSEDWAALGELLTEDSVWDDRRLGVGTVVRGRTARVENYEAVAAMGVARLESTPIATREDRLALARNVLRGVGDTNFESATLLITELDVTGRVAATILFDPDDLDAAFSELDARWHALEPKLFSTPSDFSDAFNKRDWARFRAGLTDDVEVVDHRPASLGRLIGADAWIASVRPLVELIPGVRWYVTAVHAVGNSHAVCVGDMRGTTADGAEVEIPSLGVIGFRDGRIARNEIFPIDALDEARARFEELESQASPRLQNTATRTAARWLAAFARREWEAVADCIGEPYVLIDRRAGMQVEVHGKDAVMQNVRNIADLGTVRFESKVVATRGERLTLSRRQIVGAPSEPDYELVYLSLEEVDDVGRLIASVTFDLDALDAANTELDERYIEGEGAPFADELRCMRAIHCTNTADWDGLRMFVAEGLSIVDHRPASIGHMDGIDEFIAYLRAVLDQLSSYTAYCATVHAVDTGRALFELVITGETPDGATIEIAYLNLIGTRDGRAAWMEIFPVEELDAALARFDAVLSEPPEQLENLAVRTARRLDDCMMRRDWEGARALLTDSTIEEDRRPGLRGRIVGIDACLENRRAISALGADRIEATVVALRGDLLALDRVRVRGADDTSFETEVLALVEVEPDGRQAAMVVFDSEDLDAALHEIDERYALGEGAPYAVGLRLAAHLMQAVTDRNWDAARSTLSDDFVMVSHLPASFGEIRDPDEWIESQKALLELLPEFRTEITRYLAMSSDRLLAEHLTSGVTADGVAIELADYVVAQFQSGVIVRIEGFPPEQLDAAMARFAELGAVRDDLSQHPAMKAVRAVFDGVRDGRWDDVRDLHRPDFRAEDRRSGFGGLGGLNTQMRNLRAMTFLQESGRIEDECLATRGDLLALGRYLFRLGGEEDAFEVEFLAVNGVDREGKMAFYVTFDAATFDAAIAELDERFINGEGAEYAEFVRRILLGMHAANKGDWDTVRSTVKDGIEVIDHRPVSLGRVHGVDEFIAQIQQWSGVAEFTTYIRGFVRLTKERCLYEQTAVVSADDASYEISYYILIEHRDGLTAHVEYFPTDRLNDALARFEEVGRRQEATPLENACTRTLSSLHAAFNSQDVERLLSVHAEPFRLDDRRMGLGHVSQGRDELRAYAQATWSIGARVASTETLAIRGDRFALSKEVYRESDGYGADMLAVDETDTEGKVVNRVFFDTNALDAAFDDLDGRFLARGEPTESYRVLLELNRAYNARDWDRYRSLQWDDYILVDYRRASAGTIAGADAALLHRRALVDLVPDARVAVRAAIRAEERVVLFHQWKYGTDENGNRVDFEDFIIGVVENGKARRGEAFPVDQLDVAIARYDELQREAADDRLPVGLVAENDAIRTYLRLYELGRLGRWEDVPRLVAENLTLDDRRRGLSWTVSGEAVLKQAQLAIENAVASITPIATRGERLALVLQHVTSNDFEIETLALFELDEESRLATVVVFDPEHLDTAFEELNERFAAGEAAACREFVLKNGEALAALNAGDWDRFASLCVPDFVFIDHRRGSSGEIRGLERFLDFVKALSDVAPKIRRDIVVYHKIDTLCGVAQFLDSGPNEAGGQVEMSYLQVMTGRRAADGLHATHVERFEVDDLDRALARFEELRGGGSEPVEPADEI